MSDQTPPRDETELVPFRRIVRQVQAVHEAPRVPYLKIAPDYKPTAYELACWQLEEDQAA